MSMDYTTHNRNRFRPTIFVVQCKRRACSRQVLAGVDKFPESNIIVDCPLCGEVRRYRPNEVYLGVPDPILSRKHPKPERPKHLQYRREG